MGIRGLGKNFGRAEVSQASNLSSGTKAGRTSNGRNVSVAKPSLWARFKNALGFKSKISNPILSQKDDERIKDQHKGNFIKAGPDAKHPGGFVSVGGARAKAEMNRFEALTNKRENKKIRSERPSIPQESERPSIPQESESSLSEEVKESKSPESKISISNPVPSEKTIQKLQDQYKGNFIKAGPGAKHP